MFMHFDHWSKLSGDSHPYWLLRLYLYFTINDHDNTDLVVRIDYQSGFLKINRYFDGQTHFNECNSPELVEVPHIPVENHF